MYIPYYCDIGFYCNKYQKKCIEECKYENKVFFLYDEKYSKEFNINKNEIYEFMTFNPENYYYYFESSESNIQSYPRISFISRGEHIYINNEF